MRINTPKTSLSWFFLTTRYLDEVSVQAEIMPDAILPSFVSGAVVRVVFCDVAVDSAERELFVQRTGDCLHDQLGIGIWRL